MTTVIKKNIAATEVPPLLVAWLDGSQLFDITVKAGRRHGGTRTVVFTITASSKAEGAAKLYALEQLINAHAERTNQ